MLVETLPRCLRRCAFFRRSIKVGCRQNSILYVLLATAFEFHSGLQGHSASQIFTIGSRDVFFFNNKTRVWCVLYLFLAVIEVKQVCFIRITNRY